MLGALIPTGGGDTIPLTREKMLVGRRSRCDICLRFKNVSSHHCELELRDGYWYVRDLGSSNGVKVNGIRIDQKCLLPGDELMIAKSAFNIDYKVDESAQAAEEDDNPFAMSLMQKAGLEVTRDHNAREEARMKRSAKHTTAEDDFLMEWLPDDD